MNVEQGSEHTFHIPVMGTAFTIDSPIKVARFGISSVVSLCDDELCEAMGQHYAVLFKKPYNTYEKLSDDFRANRIREYLNLLHDILNDQMAELESQSFDDESNDLNRYFELLPTQSVLFEQYQAMKACESANEKQAMQAALKSQLRPGSIDVNIMTKLDRDTYGKDGQLLDQEFSDALAALRGFASSKLHASIVFSAGFNRRLYSYIEQFSDFYPDENGYLKKKVVLKVSDFRSSLTQGKFLAKKGVWVSENRIESGLNCGGHAFATDGYLLGPILDEFKQKRAELSESLYTLCNDSLAKKGKTAFASQPRTALTVQGGIGTGKEQQYLLQHFEVDGTGWASPFLLVEEATTLDAKTRTLLKEAGSRDFYLSGISPLGVPFNTVRGTESEEQKLQRYDAGKPGSPCPKGYLVSNKDFSKKPVCTAAIFFQKRKLNELQSIGLASDALKEESLKVINKACLCEDLAAAALTVNGIENGRPLKSAVCPGPNLAYFSGFYSLKDMVSHIYDKVNLISHVPRSNMFISELRMYIDYFKKELQHFSISPSDRQLKTLQAFKDNLRDGISYYNTMIPTLIQESAAYRDIMARELSEQAEHLESLLTQYQHELQPASV